MRIILTATEVKAIARMVKRKFSKVKDLEKMRGNRISKMKTW